MNTILYIGRNLARGSAPGLERLGARRHSDGSLAVGEHRIHEVQEASAAAAFLANRAVDLLLVDTREGLAAPGQGRSEAGAFDGTRAGDLLARLFPSGQLYAAIQRERVLGIVGSGPDAAEAAYHMGAYGLGGLIADPSLEELLARADSMSRRPAGRVAICLAGGGIEGLLYEVGVLRALDSFLVDRPIVDFDIFCGISAGSILGSFLANGIGPDEIARGLAGGSARIDAVQRGDLFDPNYREVLQRLRGLGGELLRGGVGPRGVVSSLVRALPSGLFAGDRLQEYLRRQLERPGMSNRFSDLRRPLFVGATDQDTSQAVVFGEPGFDHVPVHEAVRASSALTPFYAPAEIDGRYYVDGAFTRTTNMRVAVHHGATLVILVDPLVPVFSQAAGYVRDRGGLFIAMQGLKALINGRFDKAVRAIRQMYPDVSFYLFRPYGDEMRILSGSPMKYFYRREVEEIAYRNTVDKIRTSLPELKRDFGHHGITFRDPSRDVATPRQSAGAVGLAL